MRALVIRGPGSARVEEVEEPVPGAGQVVVDVRRAGICGTDVELFTGQLAYFAQGKTRFAAAGASVDVLGLDGGRRALARSFGATGYWTADERPPVTYDAVVDCTDDHRMPAFALALAEPAGRVVFIGVSGVPSLIDSRDLVLGDLTAVGILGASAGLAPAIEHYADGRVSPSGLVSVTVGLDQAAEALAGQIGTGSGTKIHIDPGA